MRLCAVKSWRIAAGFTLVEIIVVMAILSVVSLAFAGLFSQMSREMRATNQKNEANELRSRAATILSYLPVCDCQLSTYTEAFDASVAKPSASVSQVLSSCQSTAETVMATNSLIPGGRTLLAVDQIRIVDIEPLGTPDLFRGILRVTYKSENLVRALRGFDLEIRFETDPASPLNQKKLTKCLAVSGAATPSASPTPTVAPLQQCPSGQYLSGINNGTIQCTPLPTPTLPTVSCPADQYLVGLNNGLPQCAPLTLKSCPPGQFMYSQSNGGFDCTRLPTPTPTPPPSSPWSLSNPGSGCSSHNCIAEDFGPCTGNNCLTNGLLCKGAGCSACAVGAVCTGSNCCTGPLCPGCASP